jgi:hypothetical protein
MENGIGKNEMASVKMKLHLLKMKIESYENEYRCKRRQVANSIIYLYWSSIASL